MVPLIIIFEALSVSPKQQEEEQTVTTGFEHIHPKNEIMTLESSVTARLFFTQFHLGIHRSNCY